jgi:hypothetical protein
MLRTDETWHRLREWTNGQAPSERLASQILAHEGFVGERKVDHPALNRWSSPFFR